MNSERFVNQEDLMSSEEKLKQARIAQLESRDIEDAPPEQQEAYANLIKDVESRKAEPLSDAEFKELQHLDLEQGRSVNWTPEMARRQQDLRSRYESSSSKAA